MHELASGIMAFILSPFNWILILIIISFIVPTPRIKKSCRLSALIIFILFSNQWLISAYARLWNPRSINVITNRSYSCGIVLGGFGSPDENGDGYFNVGADRFIQALKLYKLGKIQHILISGGNGKDMDRNFKEGKWAKQQMMIMGVPANAIFCEDFSDNTAENATYTKRILDSALLQPPFLLITSDYHIPRATQIFKNVGITVVGYPCNYMEGRERFTFWGIIPKPENLFVWNIYLKETAGYFYYYLKGE
jgi:uncharacterized SAM-binding protein YcdF (DUF218 family)